MSLQAQLSHAPVLDGVTYVQGDATDIDLPDHTVDLLTVRHVSSPFRTCPHCVLLSSCSAVDVCTSWSRWASPAFASVWDGCGR